jgi:hypothetical protein
VSVKNVNNETCLKKASDSKPKIPTIPKVMAMDDAAAKKRAAWMARSRQRWRGPGPRKRGRGGKERTVPDNELFLVAGRFDARWVNKDIDVP